MHLALEGRLHEINSRFCSHPLSLSFSLLSVFSLSFSFFVQPTFVLLWIKIPHLSRSFFLSRIFFSLRLRSRCRLSLSRFNDRVSLQLAGASHPSSSDDVALCSSSFNNVALHLAFYNHSPRSLSAIISFFIPRLRNNVAVYSLFIPTSLFLLGRQCCSPLLTLAEYNRASLSHITRESDWCLHAVLSSARHCIVLATLAL